MPSQKEGSISRSPTHLAVAQQVEDIHITAVKEPAVAINENRPALLRWFSEKPWGAFAFPLQNVPNILVFLKQLLILIAVGILGRSKGGWS